MMSLPPQNHTQYLRSLLARLQRTRTGPTQQEAKDAGKALDALEKAFKTANNRGEDCTVNP